jgi:phage tail sheath gpL-like
MSQSISPTSQQTISFNEIPYNLQVPGSFFEVRPNYSQSGLVGYPAKGLIIGQMLAAGSAKPNVSYPLYSAKQAATLFGAGSVAANMAAFWIAANPYTSIDIMGVPDAGESVHAVGSIVITGTATASGTLAVYIAGNRIAVGVAAGDTAAAIATNLFEDIGALPDPTVIGATPANGTPGTVGLTAFHGGTLGNQIDIRTNYQQGDITPAGVTVTITAMATGATDPTITAALGAIATTWYTDIVTPWNDTTNVGALEAALETRYMAMGKLDSVAYGVITGASQGAIISAKGALNSRFRSLIGVQNAPQPSWIWAAAFAAIGAYYLAADPARQLKGLVLPGILAPAGADQFDLDEQQAFLAGGISTFTVQTDGTVALQRVVTEYLLNPDGIPDTAWHDIMTPRVCSRIRYDWIGYVDLTYPRCKLAPDGSLAAEYDPTVVTPSRMKSSWAGRSKIYEQNGWIVNSSVTAAASVFQINANNKNRLDADQTINIIGNEMILAGVIEFAA